MRFSCQTLTSVIAYLPQSGVSLFGSLSGASISLALRTLSRSSLCSAVSEARRALSRSLLRCNLSSLFPDDSGTLAEELLYNSIVEHVASALYVWDYRLSET